MKIVRFRAGDKIRYGVLEGSHIVEYAGTPYGTFKKGRKKYLLSQAILLSPVVPSKIVAVSLNYREHAEEMNAQVPREPCITACMPAMIASQSSGRWSGTGSRGVGAWYSTVPALGSRSAFSTVGWKRLPRAAIVAVAWASCIGVASR